MYGFIFTDSLGCPREETPFENTWPCKIVNRYKEKMPIFTFLRRGANSKTIDDYITVSMPFICPDIVIIQVGICDCSRRAMSNLGIKVVSKIPYINKLVHKFAQKHHYRLTRAFEFRQVRPSEFRKHILNIINYFNSYVHRNVEIIFIEIVKPGKALKKMTYNIEHDVGMYNEILYEISSAYKNVSIISPWKQGGGDEYDADEFVLEQDGHHLNDTGLEYLERALYNKLDDFLTVK